jgi:hypothetical protein
LKAATNCLFFLPESRKMLIEPIQTFHQEYSENNVPYADQGQVSIEVAETMGLANRAAMRHHWR